LGGFCIPGAIGAACQDPTAGIDVMLLAPAALVASSPWLAALNAS